MDTLYCSFHGLHIFLSRIYTYSVYEPFSSPELCAKGKEVKRSLLSSQQIDGNDPGTQSCIVKSLEGPSSY